MDYTCSYLDNPQLIAKPICVPGQIPFHLFKDITLESVPSLLDHFYKYAMSPIIKRDKNNPNFPYSCCHSPFMKTSWRSYLYSYSPPPLLSFFLETVPARIISPPLQLLLSWSSVIASPRVNSQTPLMAPSFDSCFLLLVSRTPSSWFFLPHWWLWISFLGWKLPLSDL